MKTLLLLIITITALLLDKPQPDVAELKRQRVAIDKYIENHHKEIILLARVPNKKDLVIVKKNKWPDDAQYSYNVLKDKSGKVIYVMGSPVSESGDWDIMYLYYFDANGKIFAFERETGFFNSMCTDDAAHEIITKYFDSDFKLLLQTYKLTDSKGKPLVKSKCQFPYDFNDYKIYPNVIECLKDYRINID